MQTSSFDVEGMTCVGCTGNVRHALSKFDDVSLRPGIATLQANPAN